MSDEFTFESGLKEGPSTIVAAEFVLNQQGGYSLELTEKFDDGTDYTRFFSVGGKDKGWTTTDGGETIQGVTADQKYNASSSIAGFISKVMDTEAGDVLRQRSAELYGRRGPFHAALWVNLRFEWAIQKGDKRKQVDGEWTTVKEDVSVPIKFLGVAGSTPVATVQATLPPTVAAMPPTADNGGVSDEELKELTKLALTHDSHGDFVDAVMETPLIRNRAVVKLIGRQAWYENTRG